MKPDEFATAKAWEQSSRIIVLVLLFLSGLQFLAAAIVFGSLGTSETDRLLTSGFLVLSGVAFALGLAFRKFGAPTWKHKLAVAILVLPAALSLLVR
ncbi:hypothetical protein [Sphingomonas jaspsi]|uniref:hypothetical protein n=1 Tax=Sphingomonas jaspsi TaxID=392409 RepID=UPI0012EBF202|nr:hypothetical protein [Sphingomonas jaspsi]